MPEKSSALERVSAHVALVEKIINEHFTEGVHFALIGSREKSLLQPGAQLLCLAFGLSAHFQVTTRREGDQTAFDTVCRLEPWPDISRETILDDLPLPVFGGEGVGSASTGETRYAYRYDRTQELVPRDYWNDHDRERWLRGGLPYKDEADNTWKIKHRVAVNPADNLNTVAKMSAKRALVAAVITTLGLSAYDYSQDLEDLAENGNLPPARSAPPAATPEVPPKPAPKPPQTAPKPPQTAPKPPPAAPQNTPPAPPMPAAPAPRPAPAAPAPAPAAPSEPDTPTVEGYIQKVEQGTVKSTGKPKLFVYLSDGQKYTTVYSKLFVIIDAAVEQKARVRITYRPTRWGPDIRDIEIIGGAEAGTPPAPEPDSPQGEGRTVREVVGPITTQAGTMWRITCAEGMYWTVEADVVAVCKSAVGVDGGVYLTLEESGGATWVVYADKAPF